MGVFHTIKDDTATAATTYTDSTVAVGRSYVYRVKALNAHGASPRSSYTRADIPQAPTIEVIEPPEPEPELTAEPQMQVPAGQIWSATLTVGIDGNASGFNSEGGTLDPTEFSYSGVDYELTGFFHSVGTGLWIFPEPLFPSHATSRLSVTLADTSHSSAIAQGTFYRFANVDPGWAEDDVVAVSLSLSNAAATGRPVINGTPQLGQTLNVDTTGITDVDGIPDDAAFACQWQRDASDISGATACTYTPVAADVGEELRVEVTFTDSLLYSETVTSDPVGVLGAPNNEAAGKPTIPSRAEVGQPLTANTDSIADADGIPDDAFGCQWQTVVGSTVTDLGGVTGCTYIPDQFDVTEALQVQVTFTDSLGNAETVTSVPTDAVVASPYTQQIWEATLTPADIGGGAVGHSGTRGGLTPASFAIGAQRYEPSDLTENRRSNAMSLVMPPLQTDFALQIGRRYFRFDQLHSARRSQESVSFLWPEHIEQLLEIGTPINVRLLIRKVVVGAPTVTISGETSAAQGKYITLTANATDPEDQTLSYGWSVRSASPFGLVWNDPTSEGTTAVFAFPPAANVFDDAAIVTLTVTDSEGNATTAYEFLGVRANQAPTVSVTAESTSVPSGETVTLTGDASDPDVPTELTYAWTSNAEGSFAESTDPSTTWTAPTVTGSDNLTATLTLTVTDDADNTASDSVVVTVLAETEDLAVSIDQPDQPVSGLGMLDLTSTQTGVTDADTVTYLWTADGGSFSTNNTADTTWTAPFPARTAQTITLTLTLTEGTAMVVDTVTVTVPANERPTLTINVPGTFVGGTTDKVSVEAMDPEGDLLDYEWTTEPSNSGMFTADTSMTTNWTAPPASEEDQTIDLIVAVTDVVFPDDPVTARKEIIVFKNGSPTVTITDPPDQVDGGAVVSLEATAEDREDDTLSYQWSADPAEGTFLDSQALNTTWTAPPTERDQQVVTLALTVTDDGAGTRSTSESVTVTVLGDEAPTRPNSLPTHLEVNGGHEESLDGTSDLDVTAYQWSTDVGSFDDTNTATPTWTAPPPDRTGDSGTITLTVTDAVGDTMFTIPVTVLADTAPMGSVSADPVTVFGGKAVNLTDNTDDDGQSSLTRLWTASPDVGSFNNAGQANTTWTAPSATTSDQPVTLTLTVTDAVGDTTFTTMVTVRPNQPPTVDLGDDAVVSGGDEVNLAPTVSDPEDDTLSYQWSANPAIGSLAASTARDTTWTAPASTRDAQEVVLTLTVTDTGVDALSGSDSMTVTVRPLNSVTVADERSAPSFASRYEGRYEGRDGDELRWKFPQRVPFSAATDYAAIGFDGFEVESRTQPLDGDWSAWKLLARLAPDDIERAPAARVRYVVDPAPECSNREWRVRALYSPVPGIDDFQDSNWLPAGGEYNRPPDGAPQAPRINLDDTWMTRNGDSYQLQLAWDPGGLPTEAECAVITGHEFERRYIIGKYYGSGDPRAAGRYLLPSEAPAWWDPANQRYGTFDQTNWNKMWFNQPDELWSILYRGNYQGDNTVNPTSEDCSAVPGQIALFWDPDNMTRDGNDIYSQWNSLPSQTSDVTTLTEDKLTCTNPPVAGGYAVSVYFYQYRVRAKNGDGVSGWTEYRFTSSLPANHGRSGTQP